MASSLTILFLDIFWPSLSISVSPGEVVAPGEAVTIRCRCWWCWGMRQFLNKDGNQIWELDVDGGEGEFTIPSARWEDGGLYSCHSRSVWTLYTWQESSDSLKIIVGGAWLEPYYPKPSISLSPSGRVRLGRAVIVRCWAPHWNMRFLLYKAGNPAPLQSVEPAGDLAEFRIRSVGREDAGSYSCYYRTKSEPPVWSEPSDPVELLVAGLPAARPSISLIPSGGIAPGGTVTVRCHCQCWGRKLLLYKDGIPIRELYADGGEGKFPIRGARREDGGAYSCRSRSRLEPPDWSDPSDSVWVTVGETYYPKPSISLSPSGRVRLGGTVTVRCRAPQRNRSFLLYKAGRLVRRQDAQPAGDLAEFPLRNASRRDAGTYSCRYSTKSGPPVWSELSDPVDLVVAEGNDPAGPQPPDPPPTEMEGEGGTDTAQPGTAPAPTRPGNTGPGTAGITIEPALETAAPPKRQDFTYANIARLGLGAAVLLVLVPILAEAYYSRPRGVS